ncbi:serine protease [Lentibacillus sp. N15]|uniref:S1 family peptidase n=1 Tax=Lentibacillus songyuanensis TaxID=3136161 RepID=UPI0031BADA57
MMRKRPDKSDRLDEDLYEDLDDDTFIELVKEEQAKALQKEQQSERNPKRPFRRWAFWVIVLVMLLNMVALLPKTLSLPAIKFLTASAKLSVQDDIRTYKKSVVTIETGESKGTGFSIAADGTIITNEHVVKENDTVTVAFPDEGLFEGSVVQRDPAVDLAVVKVKGSSTAFPSLAIAKQPSFRKEDPIYFIGNPLRFHGIANEGTIIGPTSLPNWEKEVIMIDAPVYRGNSGSPVINEQGEVIGVIFATMEQDTYKRVGLMIPIDRYKEMIR